MLYQENYFFVKSTISAFSIPVSKVSTSPIFVSKSRNFLNRTQASLSEEVQRLIFSFVMRVKKSHQASHMLSFCCNMVLEVLINGVELLILYDSKNRNAALPIAVILKPLRAKNRLCEFQIETTTTLDRRIIIGFKNVTLSTGLNVDVAIYITLQMFHTRNQCPLANNSVS